MIACFIIMNGNNGQIVNWQFTKDLPQKNDIIFVFMWMTVAKCARKL